jgi:hypothetical protein
MGELHVFWNGFDRYVARDAEDARNLFNDLHGSDEDDGYTFEQEPDDKLLVIWCDIQDGVAADPHCNAAIVVRKTNREWCEKFGRGFLCSSEW